MSDDTVTGAASDTVSSTVSSLASSSDTRRALVRSRDREHPGTGVPMSGIEASADGVLRDLDGHPPAAAELPDIVGAARVLAERVRAAQAIGYRVQMGFAVEALESIAVSATAKALGEAVESMPVTVPKQFETIVQGAPAA